MYKQKKAEMGVGTLIVFIAMLLVAAVAAGVLIQTSGALQEKALATGQQARSQISTNARVVEVSASNGANGNLTDFQQIIKLSPGSDPMKLDQIIFTFNTKDATATLHYRGVGSVCENDNSNGYHTVEEEEIDAVAAVAVNLVNDLDEDGATDTVVVHNSTTIRFVLSTAGNIDVTIPDISGAGAAAVTLNVQDQTLETGGTTYGTVDIVGDTNTNDQIDAVVNFAVTPQNVGEGYFSVVYEQTGTNHVDGNLQRGDIVRLCYAAPGEILEDQLVRLNFIPKIGTPTLTQFVTPDVISTERVYLYP